MKAIIITVVFLSGIGVNAQSYKAKISNVKYIPIYNTESFIDTVRVEFTTEKTVQDADEIDVDIGLGELRGDSVIRIDFTYILYHSKHYFDIVYPNYLDKKLSIEGNPFTNKVFSMSFYIGDINIRKINFGYIFLKILRDKPSVIKENDYYYKNTREIINKIDDEYKSN